MNVLESIQTKFHKIFTNVNKLLDFKNDFFVCLHHDWLTIIHFFSMGKMCK